jgi:hypothetical protein
MENVVTQNAVQEFTRMMDAGLSERRLREEIGKLSCDELASVLVMWQRAQSKANVAA